MNITGLPIANNQQSAAGWSVRAYLPEGVNFIDAEGELVLGDIQDGSGAYFSSVFTDADVPDIDLPATTDSPTNPGARYLSLGIYDQRGVLKYTLLQDFLIPASLGSTCTLEELIIVQAARYLTNQRSQDFYNAPTTDLLFVRESELDERLAGITAGTFFTDLLVDSDGDFTFESGDGGLTTSDVPEGSRLYFTAARVLATVLAGLSTAAGTIVTSSHTILQALGFLQKQVSDNKTSADGHASNTSNPHSTSKTQVGLGSVDNTSDLAKPVSTAQAAYVDGAVALLTPKTAAVNAQTGTTYTIQASDNGKVVTLSNASGITVTLPASLGAGFNCALVQIGAGQVTVSPSSTTMHNRQSHTKLAGQYASATLIAYLTDTFVLQGDTA